MFRGGRGGKSPFAQCLSALWHSSFSLMGVSWVQVKGFKPQFQSWLRFRSRYVTIALMRKSRPISRGKRGSANPKPFLIRPFHHGSATFWIHVVQPQAIIEVFLAWRKRLKKTWVIGVWKFMPLTIWWRTWKERNCRIFADKARSIQDFKLYFWKTLYN